MAAKQETESVVAALLKRVEAAEHAALAAKTTATQSLHVQKSFDRRLSCLEKDLATMMQQV